MVLQFESVGAYHKEGLQSYALRYLPPFGALVCGCQQIPEILASLSLIKAQADLHLPELI